MKEFELKYKSALGNATTMYACAKESNDKKMIQSLELIFPELKKTKDELIREELINFLETCRDPRFVGSRKQDEWIEWLKNNPIFDMPKIEFKVGDWVIFKNGTPESVYQVEKIENYAYTLRHILGGSMPLSFYSQSLLRPWTIIRDAKVGDVLEFEDHGRLVIGIISFINRATERVDTYCLLEEDKFKVGTFYTLDTINPHPVTAEQHKFFFKKMEEAGYRWDDIKKELIRYEQ